MLLIEQHYEQIIKGNPRITPDELFQKRYYSGAQLLAGALNLEGLSTTIVTACTASTAAIALAADMIRCGMLEIALAGGADAFSTSTLAGFDGLKATSEGKCAPFSKPPGLNLGEAAAFVVLESMRSAEHRGARVHAEIAGSGMSNDAYHCSSPEPTGRGLALAMQRALRDSGVGPGEISYINAHGTGTEANDKAETRAMRRVFGEQTGRIPVSSTKSMVGHCLGAAGALEVIASILCAKRNVLPPTVNFSTPREGCTLDCVPQAGRPWSAPQTFLSSNLAFGGHNASLVIRMPGDHAAPTPDCRAEDEVYLTGFGLVSPAGIGLKPLLQTDTPPRLTQVGIGGLPEFEAALVPEDAVEKFDRRLDLRGMDRSSRWSSVAARVAMREAGLPEDGPALRELGLVLAFAAGPSWAESEFLTSFLSNDRQVNQLLAFPYIVPSSVTGNVCRALRITGYNLTLSSGPGAGLLSVGPALAALRSGQAECVLAGAVDELSERIMADTFLAGRIGQGRGVPGEGAAFLVLEKGEHARARKAKPLAVVRGFSSATAALNGSASSSPRIERAIAESLHQAKCTPADIDCLSLAPGLFQQLLGAYPEWRNKRHEAPVITGRMEGAESLLHAVLALVSSSRKVGRVLAITESAESGCVALVLEQNGEWAPQLQH
jgi:3-oxoacyl-[acyl-carrier-protein] synthase II